MAISTPTFTKINEEFTCIKCNKFIPKASSTCRDHCPHCLHSVHVDINPGDREANCNGILAPISYTTHPKKGIMIHYQCQKCKMKKVNKFLQSDKFLPDNYDNLLKLSSVVADETEEKS